MRIIIPVYNSSGLDAPICNHFGRTPFFSIIDLDENGSVINQNTVSSSGEHFCEGITFLANFKPDIMIAQGMGQRVIQNFQNERITILRTNANVVKDAIRQYNKGELVELTEGCH